MDSELASAMKLYRFLSLPGVTFLSVVVALSLPGALLIYLVARWRAHRASVVDPQLGLKVALHSFATAAFHLALYGGARLVFAIIGPDMAAEKGDLYRSAFAMLVPAGLILGVHVMLLRRTNDLDLPAVRRLFLGYNTIVTGLVGFVALALGFQILFAKGTQAPLGHLAGSAVLVYGGAWALLGWRLSQLVMGDWSGTGGLPDEVVPPSQPPHQPPPAAAAGGGPSLPSLGGGSYPPIDPR